MRIQITTKQGALVEEWLDNDISSYDLENEDDYAQFTMEFVDAVVRGWMLEGSIESYEQEDNRSKIERMARHSREDEHLVRGDE